MNRCLFDFFSLKNSNACKTNSFQLPKKLFFSSIATVQWIHFILTNHLSPFFYLFPNSVSLLCLTGSSGQNLLFTFNPKLPSVIQFGKVITKLFSLFSTTKLPTVIPIRSSHLQNSVVYFNMELPTVSQLSKTIY